MGQELFSNIIEAARDSFRHLGNEQSWTGVFKNRGFRAKPSRSAKKYDRAAHIAIEQPAQAQIVPGQ